MADFEDILGGAAGGAASGAALGPWGALAGGVLGGVLGGFKKKPPKFTDPYQGLRDFGISQLLTSHQGADQAAVTAGWNQQLARDQMEQVGNNSNFASNAAALSGIDNKIQRESERGSQSAALQGAAIDSQSRAQGLSALTGASELAQNQFMLNQGYADRPTFLETLGQNALGTAAGLGASNLATQAPPQPSDGGLTVPPIFNQQLNPPTTSAPSLTNAVYPEFPKTMAPNNPNVYGENADASFNGLSSLSPAYNPISPNLDYDYLNSTFSPSRYLLR